MFNGVNTITGYDTEMDAFGTLRLRAGYALGRTLVFASGGLAAGRIENRFSLTLPELGYASPDWSEEGLRWGYAVGAGVEREVAEALSVRVELLHYDLRDTTVYASDPTTFPGQTIAYEFSNSGQIARIGIVKRF